MEGGVLTWNDATDSYDLSVGGSLGLSSVWSKYNLFKIGYVAANDMNAFLSKYLKGDFVYSFTINPAVVTVNTSILMDKDAWQQSFEEATAANDPTTTFFNYMKCTGVTYDESTGLVSVTFSMDENGTGRVSVKTTEQSSARPSAIWGACPEGSLVVEARNFKKGETAIYDTADFSGEIDLDPWMALIFPLYFNVTTNTVGCTLDVPDSSVSFAVENGTWADGTTDPISVTVPMDVANLGTEDAPDWQAAGTLTEDMVPTGMLPISDKYQKTGYWSPELDFSENAITYPDKTYRAPNAYTYIFPLIEYTLTWNTNGGNAIESKSYPVDTEVDLSETPTRAGYEFTGWYSDEDLKDKITSVTMDGDKTVYAGWKAIEPDKPAVDEPKDEPTDEPKDEPTNKPSTDTNKPSTDKTKPSTTTKPSSSTNKTSSGNKTNSVKTSAWTMVPAFVTAMAASAAALTSLMKKRKHK